MCVFLVLTFVLSLLSEWRFATPKPATVNSDIDRAKEVAVVYIDIRFQKSKATNTLFLNIILLKLKIVTI